MGSEGNDSGDKDREVEEDEVDKILSTVDGKILRKKDPQL